MEEWIEEDLNLLSRTEEQPPRVLDQRMIREPIRLLAPRRPVTSPPSATVEEVIGTMREHRIGCVLVVDEDLLLGIITERDLLLKVGAGQLGLPVREFMTADPEVLRPEDPIVYALNKMSVGGFRHIPLVDEGGRAVGVVSVKDIIDYIVDFFPNDVLTVAPDPLQGERWHGRDGG